MCINFSVSVSFKSKSNLSTRSVLIYNISNCTEIFNSQRGYAKQCSVTIRCFLLLSAHSSSSYEPSCLLVKESMEALKCTTASWCYSNFARPLITFFTFLKQAVLDVNVWIQCCEYLECLCVALFVHTASELKEIESPASSSSSRNSLMQHLHAQSSTEGGDEQWDAALWSGVSSLNLLCLTARLLLLIDHSPSF